MLIAQPGPEQDLPLPSPRGQEGCAVGLWSLMLGRSRLDCNSLLTGGSSDAQCPAALLDEGTAGWGCLSQQGHQASLILSPSGC